MAKHRTHSIEFKRQVVQEFLGGESPHALAKRHGISRNLIKSRAPHTTTSRRSSPSTRHGWSSRLRKSAPSGQLTATGA